MIQNNFCITFYHHNGLIFETQKNFPERNCDFFLLTCPRKDCYGLADYCGLWPILQ